MKANIFGSLVSLGLQVFSLASILALGLLSGCSSTKEKAFNLLKSEQYDSAVTAFEIVLQSSPLDAESQAGLKKSREGVISTQLLKVRSFRLSNNGKQATQLLEDTLLKQNKWGVAPEGPVVSTLNEEISYAVSHLKGQIMEVIREEKPLKGKLLEKNFPGVLSTGGKLRAIADLDRSLQKLGQKDCAIFQNEARNGKLFYLGKWSTAYCAYWGLSTKNPVSLSAAGESLRYSFGKSRISTAVKNAPATWNESNNAAIKSVLENSPFFLAELRATNVGSTAEAKVVGDFKNDYKEWPETLTHSYSVEVPYTSYESQAKTVQKKKLVCRTSAGNEEEISSPRCRGQTPYSTYLDETVWEQVPVTRMRSEPRTYRHEGMAYTHNMDVNLNLSVKMGDLELQIPLTDPYQKTGTHHRVSVPDIGLNPEPLSTPTPLEWLSQEKVKLAEILKSELQNKWFEFHCGKKIDGSVVLAEKVLGCIAGNPTPTPSFVDEWFENRLGVSHSEAQELF